MWVNRFRPAFGEIPQIDILKLREYVLGYSGKRKKALLLHGPPGSCKTASVHALARELDLELVEVNASDFRTADEINSRVGNSVRQRSLFSMGKLIFIDEVDGISGQKDRGGVKAIVDIIEGSSFPVVIAANDAFADNIKSLKSKCELLEFPAVSTGSVVSVIESVFRKAGVDVDKGVVKSIARRSGGDVRGAIIDAQMLHDSGCLSADGVQSLSDRERSEGIMSALMRILKTTDPAIAVSSLEGADIDLDEFLLWLDENVPKEYSGYDLARAYGVLSRADVFRGRIRRQQYWGFLRYVNCLLTAGIAVSKDGKRPGFVKYARNSRLLKIWLANRRYAKRKSIAEKLGAYCHCSGRKALDFLPLVRPVIDEDIAGILGLDEDEVAWLGK